MDLTRSTKHQTRFLTGPAQQELGVSVVVTFPEPGGDLGFRFECDQPLDEEDEDAVIARTRSALLRTLEENGGIPEGGVSVNIAVEIPRELLDRVQLSLPSVVAHVAAENLHTALTAPSSVWAVRA